MRLDIKHTDDGDINLSSGDLRLDEPTEQHQRDLLIGAPGTFREKPEVGVDSIKYLRDHDHPGYMRAVRKEFTRDGMKVGSIEFIDEELENRFGAA